MNTDDETGIESILLYRHSYVPLHHNVMADAAYRNETGYLSGHEYTSIAFLIRLFNQFIL